MSLSVCAFVLAVRTLVLPFPSWDLRLDTLGAQGWAGTRDQTRPTRGLPAAWGSLSAEAATWVSHEGSEGVFPSTGKGRKKPRKSSPVEEGIDTDAQMFTQGAPTPAPTEGPARTVEKGWA